MVQIKRKVQIYDKIRINAYITNFVCIWKLGMEMQIKVTTPFKAAAKLQKNPE